jgi:hypothetical protein
MQYLPLLLLTLVVEAAAADIKMLIRVPVVLLLVATVVQVTAILKT